MSDWIKRLEDREFWEGTRANVGGAGSATALPMSEEEKAAAKKRPLGFAPPPPPKRKRARPN